MPETNHPHDAFFKKVFSRADVAADFLTHYLPPEVLRLLDVQTLELIKDTFVAPELQQHFSDLLYRVKLKRGGEAFVYLLLEHKSAPERWAAFQLLRYAVRIWEPLVERNVKKLPPVFPLILHHGRTRWRVARQFSALIDWREAEELRPYVPEFAYFLCDLTALNEAEIKGEARLRVALLVLKHIFSRDIGVRLAQIFRPLKSWPLARARAYLTTIVEYLHYAPHEVNLEHLRAGIKAVFAGKEGEKVMESFADTWIQKGRQEEAAAFALRLLKRRFNKVEARAQEQVRALSVTQLEELGESLFDLRTQDELMAWLQKQTSKKQ